jgi:alkylation response protein AidB-like acyl-CoA dehydrogenase
VQNTLANVGILKWGTDEQKARWLPRLSTDTVASFCLSEWGSGSDAFALKTKAKDCGSHFELTGSKAWITNSGEADLFVVFATTDPALGYKGISAFVVESRDAEGEGVCGNSLFCYFFLMFVGLSIMPAENKLGIRASSTCEVVLEGVKVPKENVLGPLGKGYKIAIESLNEGRIGIGAQMVGLAQGALDIMLPYIEGRRQFGERIADFQGMQFQAARCAVEIESARLMVYNAARLKEAGEPFLKEAAMAKLYASEVAEQVASRTVEALGGMGFVKASGAEKFYRDAKIGKIYEGTSHICLQTIAKSIISKD